MTTDKPYWEQDIAECLRVAAEIIGPNSYYLRAAEYIEEMRAVNAKLTATLETIAAFAVGNGDVCEIIAKRAREALYSVPEQMISMSFDEQPDGDPHEECAADIKQLTIALKIKTEEHNCCADDLALVRGERDAFADLNHTQFLELEYLRPIVLAAENLLFESEEYDFDDGLGKGAQQTHWDDLASTLEPKTEAIEEMLNASPVWAIRRNGGDSSSDAKPPAYRFLNVTCSQCGGEFGPADQGFSHCKNHKHLPRLG